MAPINPIDYVAVRNTLAEYCIALDAKDWSSLQSVLTADIDAHYPFAEMREAHNVANAIAERLLHITSNHALTTQTIEIENDGKSAKATTYFTAIHFGKGKWQGQQLTAWGKYYDALICIDEDGLPGASGNWKIKKRVCAIMATLGEIGVFEG